MGKVKLNWFKVAMVVIPAVRQGLAGIEAAIEETSDEGEKITADEAGDIATAILAEIYEPLIKIIVDAAK